MLKQNGQTRNQGVFYDVSPGDFNWQITPNSDDNIDITFTAKNNYNIQKLADVDMNVSNPNFTVELNHPNSAQTADPNVPIELVLNGSNQYSYTVSYTISPNNGSLLKRNGNPVAQNSDINVGATNFTFEFADNGNYNVNFTVESELNVEVQQGANFAVNHTPYSFVVNGNNSVLLNQPLNLSVLLNGSNNIGYTMARSIQQGIGNFSIGNNVAMGQGNNPLVYTPTSTGNHTLRFTVTDEYGQNQIVNKNITVEAPKPIINGTNSFGYSTANCSNGVIQKTCDLTFVVDPNYTSNFDITHFRTRVNNVTSGQLPFVLDVVLFNAGQIIVTSMNDINPGNVTIPTNTMVEFQLKDENGTWSDWYQMNTPGQYGIPPYDEL